MAQALTLQVQSKNNKSYVFMVRSISNINNMVPHSLS